MLVGSRRTESIQRKSSDRGICLKKMLQICKKNVKGMHLSSNLEASFPVNSSKKATKKEEDEKKRFQFDPTYIPLGRNALSTYLKPAL